MITTDLVKSMKVSETLQKERDYLLRQLRDREDSLLCKVCLAKRVLSVVNLCKASYFYFL
jgi:hypothetical protein